MTAAEKRIAAFARLAQRLTNDAAVAPSGAIKRSAEEALDRVLADIRSLKAGEPMRWGQ